MGNVLIQESSLQAIADAIRCKTGGTDTYKPREMAPAIRNLPGTGVLQNLTVTENGNYTPGAGVDGFNSVSVAVPNSYSQSDEGKVVSNGVLVAQTSLNVSTNGTYDTTTKNSVIVNVSADGRAVLIGNTPPTASIGNNGDIYVLIHSSERQFDVNGYTMQENLYATTAGPYIKTGVISSPTAYYEVDFQYISPYTDDRYVFGIWRSYQDMLIGIYQGKWNILVGGSGCRGSLSPDYDRHKLAANADGIYLDGTKIGTPNWSNAPSGEYYLFRDNGHSACPNVRVFGCKIYNGATLIRDFVPVIRDSDSTLGMFDQVNEVFYTNDGTGSFQSAGDAPQGENNYKIDHAYIKLNGAWVTLVGAIINYS